ncbi:MAG: hypothetical protein ACFB0C_10740 [Leptolyngbyaceae cyanobacterium]
MSKRDNRHYNKEPQYSSQRMIGASATLPAMSPWLYWVRVASGRSFAIFLSVADGVISFQGIRAGGSGWFAALCGAIFIAVIQLSMWAALSSGQPVGERYQQRFFEDTGPIGIMKRCFGVLMIVLIAGFYCWDIGSNYSAFTQGRWVPIAEGEAITLGVVVRIGGYILLAIAFSLGDEMLHVISDENALGQRINAVRFQGQHYEAELLGNYQRHYMKQAKPVADQMGADHGGRWRPRDIN